ncbi:MAG: hypothetical protein DSO07_09740 [Thermoproteota archaeon]|uniref:Uncharacterized protein n=1 Tax=Candidatus Methanodesulfokora washburnensis TaxID=2478471 RepID=A0A520KQ68_9CREN|nr:MAG: hypothetical protein EF810_01425 [Candidatus Methanodesulfokores washburnensis]TDA39978.1 MAG: hypothetical protein DSO07_09740 [Candidatus Korarchaeota archaeon]
MSAGSLISDRKLIIAIIVDLILAFLVISPLIYGTSPVKIKVDPDVVPLNSIYTVNIECPAGMSGTVEIVFGPTEKLMYSRAISGSTVLSLNASEGAYSVGLYIVRVKSSEGKFLAENTFSVIWGENLSVNAFHGPIRVEKGNYSADVFVEVKLKNGSPVENATVWAFSVEPNQDISPFPAKTNKSGIAVLRWSTANLTENKTFHLKFNVAKPGHHLASAMLEIEITVKKE